MQLRAPMPSRGRRTLDQARCGERVRIVALHPAVAASCRLRELGFLESTELRKICDGNGLICQILGCRIAISREVAAGIVVENAA